MKRPDTNERDADWLTEFGENSDVPIIVSAAVAVTCRNFALWLLQKKAGADA